MSSSTGVFTRGYRAWQSMMASRPGFDYLMLRTVVFLLTGIGVVMVMSSSMTWSVIEGSTVWGQSLRQGLMVVLGLLAFWAALRVPPTTVRRIAPWLMIISLLLLVAVLIPGIGEGSEEVGSQSWIRVGSVGLQPSELAKVAIAVWGAAYLADRTDTRITTSSPFTIYLGVMVVMTGLIAAQGDIGMTASFALVGMFTFVFAGGSLRVVLLAGAAAALGLVGIFLGGGFRSNRFTVYFDALFGRFEDTQGAAFQSYQGFLSLADGSLFGVGLGQSRAKWFYLPEAKNDFIFAIIGEELGLWGGALVIILFATLGYFGYRTATSAQNQFQSLMAAALTAGVVSQAFINIGYVVGLMPVTGIQLPMISAGGTSAIITLGSMGLLASVARHEPEAVSAMQSYGRPFFDRFFLLPEPTARKATTARERRPQARFGAPVTGTVREKDRTQTDRRR